MHFCGIVRLFSILSFTKIQGQTAIGANITDDILTKLSFILQLSLI